LAVVDAAGTRKTLPRVRRPSAADGLLITEG
jgi:hypothetical protein